jgi:integrase
MSVRKVTWGGVTIWEAAGEPFPSLRAARLAYPGADVRKVVTGDVKSAWAVDYKDQYGKRRSETYAKKKDADARAAQIKVDVAAHTHTPINKSATVRIAGEAWIEHQEKVRKLERSTVAGSRQHLNDWIYPALGHVKLAYLSKKMVHDFHASVAGAKSKAASVRNEDQTLSDTTVKKVLGSLKSILKHARAIDLMAHNPTESIEIESKARAKRQLEIGVDIPTRDEIAAIVAVATGIARPLVLLAVFAGFRASEIRGLRWQDVDFTRGTVTVRQRADRYREIGNPKSKKSQRTIPVPPTVINALREWRLQRLEPKSDSDLVLAARSGEAQTHGNLYMREWLPLLKAAGLEDKGYTLHSLRHFFCSWLINRKEEGGRGLSLKQAQVLMGHSTLAMTSDRYGHLLPSEDDAGELAAAAERLIAVPRR